MTYPTSRKNNVSSILRTLLMFKVFELIVVMLVLSTLYYHLINRVLDYRSHYESAEVSWTIARINSARHTALAMREVDRALGRKTPGDENTTPNPFVLLNPTPHNYIGEICDPDPTTVRRGVWYFDKCNSWLVYVFSEQMFFASRHPKMLRFNVESLHLLADPR